MIDSEEIPEDILKEAERVLAGFKVTVSGEPQVTVFEYPQWRLLIAFALLRERRRHETETPPPSTHVLAEDVRRAASALLDTLWLKAWSGARTQEENWEEMDRQFPQARWLSDALKAERAALATTEGSTE